MHQSANNELSPGHCIGYQGRYRIEKILGKGGFGVAYLATDTQLGRLCVVKHLVLKSSWSTENQQRVLHSFAREARLLVSLNTPGHPNIPEIYEYLPEEQCLVMKYIQGLDLHRTRAKTGGSLPLHETLRSMRDVCSALAYMHSRSPEPVLHRDIKPANILLDEEERIWLIDFGLARAIPASIPLQPSEKSQISGTMGYTPPEQWNGRAEPRSDIYALAVTLYTLLTGQKPAAQASDYLAIVHGAQAPIPPLRQVYPDAPPALEDLLQRSVAYDPHARPTAQEFLDTLDTLLAPHPQLPPPPEPEQPPQTSSGFVGRSAEIAYFADQLATTRQAIIIGTAGVGKTTLAAALARQLAMPRTFWHAFHQDEGIETLIWQLAAFLAWHGQDDLWQTLQHSQQGEGQLPPPATLLDYLVQMLAPHDTLLCLDNVEAMAESDLLETFIQRITNSGKTQVILTSRCMPEFLKISEVSTLAGLSLSDVWNLLAAQNLSIPEPLIAQLHAITEGNAQFLMLAIDTLRNARNPQKLLANLTETDDIEHYLLREVDDSLSETEREVMEGLAILGGHPGTRDAIEAVVEQRRLRRILSDLRLRNLIIVSESSDDGTHLYRQHAMLQAFYYESLSKRERNKLHRRAADYYSEEADWLKAARHLLRAGEEQQAAQLATAHFWQSINQGEAGSLGSLLSQIDRTQLDWHQQTDVLLAQGKVATLQRNSEQARTTYQETINLLQNRADAPEIRLRWSQACRGMGNLLEYEAPHDALQWLEQGKEKLQGVAEAQHEQALMHHRTGSVYLALGDYAQAEQELTQSMTLLTADDLHARADVLMNLGVVYCCRGEVAQGKACYQQAYDIYQQVHHYWGMLGIRGNLGYEMRLAGDWTGSIAEYTTMRDMAIQLGSITHQVTAELNLGLVMMNMGDHEAAWKHLSTCLELARTVNLREFEIASIASLADLHIRWQEPAEAAPLLEEAARLAHEFDARDQLPEIYRLQARIALAHDELDAALELAQRAEQTARSVESDFDTGLALRVLGQVLHAHGEHTHAMHAYEQSLHLLQEDPYETARTQRQWATSLAETGNHEQARTLLHTAHTTFTQLGATADLEEVNALCTCTG